MAGSENTTVGALILVAVIGIVTRGCALTSSTPEVGAIHSPVSNPATLKARTFGVGTIVDALDAEGSVNALMYPMPVCRDRYGPITGNNVVACEEGLEVDFWAAGDDPDEERLRILERERTNELNELALNPFARPLVEAIEVD